MSKNYEAIGRYTDAKATATRALKSRNSALYDLRRWAEYATNTDAWIALDEAIGQDLLRQALLANSELETALAACNAEAHAAQLPVINLRNGFFKP